VTVSTAEAYQALDELVSENEDLRAENLLLKAQLVTARDKLATANVYANRRGW
jgi:regulator of replication initiation timing